MSDITIKVVEEKVTAVAINEGPAGAPGSQWRSGAGVPANSLGINGDFYINVTTSEYYYKSGGTYSLAGTIAPSNVPSGGTTGQALVKNSNTDFDMVWATVVPTGSFNTIAGFDNSGDLQSIPGMSISTTSGGLALSLTNEPNAVVGGTNIHSYSQNVEPLQNSPSESLALHASFINLDTNSSGFTFGTSGNAATSFSNVISHLGTGNVGAIVFHNNYFNLGNGTDPISVKGISYNYGFGNVNANVTIDGPIQGYGFQFNIDPAAATSNSYAIGFYDFAQCNVAINGWQSFVASPTILQINNNSGYTGFTNNPNITTFQGNAGYSGININPTITTMGTNGFQGIYARPVITNAGSGNHTGVFIDMSAVLGGSGTIRAIDVIGDVNINGSLAFSGGLSIGQLQAYYQVNPVDGGGNPASVHGMVSSVVGLNGVTTANCDTIGTNTAMLIELQANSINTSGPIGLGFAALALPCVVETHTGSSLDNMSGAVFAINLAGTSTGGTIDTLNICRSLPIPNGITTVNKSRGYHYGEPFGGVATDSWGLYIEAAVENFMQSSLKIGGTVGTTDVVTNSSVALEVESTTRAILLSRMTTTERDALTGIDGMLLYNTTTNKLQGYASGAWVDLH